MAYDVVRTARGPSLLGLLNPVAMVRNLWSNRHLLIQLAKRDVQGRHRAAQLGLVWAIMTPLVLLGIYTFMFTVIMPSSWGEGQKETVGSFALTMFSGLILFNLFSEMANRAPLIVVGNTNYVKKVIFPLEVLVVSALLSAPFNMMISVCVWLVGRVLLVGLPPLSILWLPVVTLPVCLLSLAVGWLLASLGVFVRDVGHAVGLVVQVLFFATPIFYSLQKVPVKYRGLLEINPLAHVMEDVRRVMMTGGAPQWSWWWPTFIGSGLAAVVSYAFFMKSKRAFGDVL